MTIWKDLQFGIRMISKHAMLSATAIVTFGLGIGLTTIVFSIVNGALFKGLPFERADRLVALWASNPAQNADRLAVSIHDYAEWRKQQTVFAQMGAFGGVAVNLSGISGQPERFLGAVFTASMFETLGVRPVMGRPFRPEEDRPGAEPVMILSYEVWRDRFDSSPDVLGMTVRANGRTRTIVGVMPEGFGFPALQKLWLPLETDPLATERGQGPNFNIIARLRDGVSPAEAQAQASTIASRLAAAYPQSNRGLGASVRPFLDGFLGPEIYALLFTMLGAAVGVLIIACVNVTNLMLARASLRTREVAVRAALGAGRGRLILQLMLEVLLLALAGSALGMLFNYAGMKWFLAAIAVNPPPFWITFDLDYRVMLFVLLTTLAACLLAGLVPALQASRTNVSETLKDESRGATGFRMGKFVGALVVAEVALSCGLLIGAGLMIKSVVRLRTIDLPFTRNNIFTARINLPVSEYPTIESRIHFYDQLLPRLESIPGVERATLSDGLPAAGNGALAFELEGRRYERPEDYPIAREGIVTPGYFQTFQTTVLQGREFQTSDRQGSLPVAVVNQTFVRTFFPDGEVLGKRFRKGRNDAAMQWLTVVGIVPDMLMEGIGNNNASPAGFYIPIAQSNVANFVSIAIRTQGPPMQKTQEIRAAVASLDSNLAIFQVLSLNGVIDRQTWFYTVFGTLFVAFGLAALFLAVVGLYSVMSFAVTRRTPEIGIRMALGAQPRQLVSLIMKRGIVQIVLGIVFGLGLAMLAAQPLQTILFRVDVRDPAVFGTVLAALAGAGLLACLIPARRVQRVDPMTALTPE